MRSKVLSVVILLCITLCACGTQELNESETINANSADYWIAKAEQADKILMTENEIADLNEAMMNQWGTDWYSGYYDVTAFPKTIDEEWIEERICYLELRHAKLYSNGELVTTEQWDAYYANLNLDGIIPEVKYAVTVDNAAAYDLPTADVLTSSASGTTNSLQQTTLKINEPIVVLHESSDGKWLYVVANEYIGWVEESACAYCQNYTEWTELQNDHDYVMVTKDTTLEKEKVSLYMGTKIYFSQSDESDCVLLLPQKGEDGFVTYSDVDIIFGENFCKGNMPYTRENIIKLAFQELDEPYGWGGANGDRDCSMYVKDIYSCFGIEMPRNSRLQMAVPLYGETFDGQKEDAIAERLESACMGDVLGISGHVMLYLGEANGQHYVISMLSSYVPETVSENFAEHIETVNKVQVNSLDVRRKNGNTWLQELIAIVNIQSDN